MDASRVLWKQWHEQVKQWWGGLHGHQQKALALCVLGIIVSGSAVLQRIALWSRRARALPGQDAQH